MIRGVVEGFYGRPWTHETRLDLLAFCGREGFNTWVHAPKDDPYHRERWRDPYPDEELDRFAELVRAADAHSIAFVYAIAPGLSICYSDGRELETLVAKCEQLVSAGVRFFHLLFDDIEHDLHCPSDHERYGREVRPSAAAQADLCNRFQKALTQDRPLVVCPMGYAGVERTPYRDTLGRLLDAAAVVYWTGPQVVSDTITRTDLDAAAEAFAHEVLLWDNYPANDTEASSLHLGPLQGRDPQLWDGRLAGMVSLPMVQAVPSKLALVTIADFGRDPDGYDPVTSYERALHDYGAEVVAALRATARGRAPVARVADVPALVKALTETADIATGVALLEEFV